MKRLIITLPVFIIFIFFVNCERSNTPLETKTSPNDIAKSNNLPKILETDLFMPDSIPDVVNNRALDLALEFNYSNIRILGIKNLKEPSYHVFFYEDDLGGLKAFQINLNKSEKTVVSEREVSLPYDSKLPKPMDDYKCWDLATIYSDPYYSGSSFKFTASTTTYGWYHKVVNYLRLTNGCCGGQYPGTFDNIISSFTWKDEHYSPQYRICRPIGFHAFDEENRDNDGVDINWERNDSHYAGFDPSAPLGDTCRQLLEDFNWNDDEEKIGGIYITINNKASSLDMFFRVFTPSDCD